MNETQKNFISTIYDALSKYNFTTDVKLYIASQFALESAYGTSKLARFRNNYSGMRTPLVRISCANNAGKPTEAFASYSNLNDCLDDYILCIQYHRPLSTEYDNVEHYKKFIQKFYCPQRDYIDRINKIYSQLKG